MSKKILKQIQKISIITILLVVLFGCSKDENNNVQTKQTKNPEKEEENSKKSEIFEVIENMKIGWNLGNALESVDYKKTGLEVDSRTREGYQVMAIYNDQTWSGWDASECPYLSEDGSFKLTWKLDKLTSSSEGVADKISLQVINHDIKDIKGTTLELNLDEAFLVDKAGNRIILNDMLGTHNVTFEGDCTTYISEELNKLEGLETTSDLEGGTLYIQGKVTEFNSPRNASNIVDRVAYYETLWGSPITTKELIDSVASSGFGAIRIPVSYYDHMDKYGNIDQKWMDRVEEIVNYVLDNNIYCIINIHHDSKWLVADSNKYSDVSKKFKAVWEQIATRFKNYDSKYLIFEGFNELLTSDSNWTGTQEGYNITNKLNQDFVTTVRNTGGMNASRILCVNTYAAGTSKEILSNFVLPKDTVSNRLMVQVHSYLPREFSWTEKEVTWTQTRNSWGSDSDKSDIDDLVSLLNETFIKQGIPVIVGEFGAWNKNNLEARTEYAKYYITSAKKYHIPCFWWDCGGSFVESCDVNNSALFNRKLAVPYFDSLVKAMVNAAK